MNNPTLNVINLSCVRMNRCLFTNLSFELKPQAVLLIEGSNGAGKSSLLRLLAGLSTPQEGKIEWCGQSIHRVRENYYQDLHYIGHTNGIKLGLTVFENLQLAKQLIRTTHQPDYDAVLTELNLSLYKHTYANELSAGQKRRLALARLLLFPKQLWIIDEPYTSLDVDTQLLFLAKLKRHCEQGGMAIISSHHAMDLADVTLNKVRLGSC